jgi:guanylate kinase
LNKRGTETKKEIQTRYKIATKEMKELNDLSLCDYRIINRYIPVATEVLRGILRAERL